MSLREKVWFFMFPFYTFLDAILHILTGNYVAILWWKFMQFRKDLSGNYCIIFCLMWYDFIFCYQCLLRIRYYWSMQCGLGCKGTTYNTRKRWSYNTGLFTNFHSFDNCCNCWCVIDSVCKSAIYFCIFTESSWLLEPVEQQTDPHSWDPNLPLPEKFHTLINR